MSYEWSSRNGRGRLSVHSDDILQRYDKLTSSLDARTRNTMLVHEDNISGERRVIVAEECLVWEDERYVYMQLRGRTANRTESIFTSHSTRSRRTRTPISVYDY